MSIVPFIHTHEGTGVLRRVAPPKGKAAHRGVLLTAQAQRDFDDPHSVVNILGSKASVQVMLERWISNGVMPVRMNGTKPGAYLARLDAPPPDVWEFRITEPVNQIRVFLRFARPDLIVVTNMSTRRLLGKKGSVEWQRAMAKSVSEWDSLFPGVSPHQGVNIYDFVTKNYRQVGR